MIVYRDVNKVFNQRLVNLRQLKIFKWHFFVTVSTILDYCILLAIFERIINFRSIA